MELISAYCELTTPLHRAGAVIGAFLFVVIETFWITITTEDDAGNVKITGWTGELGHSSYAQFWSNVIFTPLILFLYRAVVTHPFLRVILFPVNIWLLEIIEGYVIMFLFGRNVAWEYRGTDAFFHGNIKLGYTIPWVSLGGVVELAWEPVIYPLAVWLEQSGMTVSVLMLAGGVTLLCSPQMGVKGVWYSLQGLDSDGHSHSDGDDDDDHKKNL